ncbi:glycoside hydrolase family 92 protein [Carboxylicivirga sp. N1Y132]|uniref:Glycoside hydrolase family 92 protein n=1 Tax=Carboxylicivirga marina TaxID=2800988 RepID=A0ABS1HQ76_9BACT|nr:glycoside hydrolase family 92 protein [Carboxylicivirga marina]
MPITIRRTNAYIQSATLNGEPYKQSYLHHDDLMKGGELVFEMGAKPNKNWGVGVK